MSDAVETGFVVLLGFSGICYFIVLLLLLHHYAKHSRQGRDYIENRCNRLFQSEDVCSDSHSHEKYEVAYGALGTILLLLAFVLYPS